MKTQASIRDSDPPSTALQKLERVLADARDGAWLLQRLSALVGVESEGTGDRTELFAAWRRYLELVAHAQPSVIVFEDLHWADEAFLAFLRELHDPPLATPLLVIGTARPELAERDPDLFARDDHVRIDLQPLTRDQIATLFAFTLAEAVLGDSIEPIVDRVGGNPLFAGEFGG